MAELPKKLLVVRINSITDNIRVKPGQHWTKIVFEHVKEKWSSKDHWVDPAKRRAFQHCYDDIRPDGYYLILTIKTDVVDEDTADGRWVWVAAVPLTEPISRKVAAFNQKSRSLKSVSDYADSLLHPKLNPDINDFFKMDDSK